MSKILLHITYSLLILAVAMPLRADDEKETKDPLDGLKCFMMKKRDVKGKKVVDYKEGKLYLCCSSCVKRMARTPEKYEAQANHQLVYTKQYKQAACPLTGKELGNKSPKLKIGGVEVAFMDADSVEKIKAMEEDDQIAKVFGTDGFKTGKFTFVKPKK
ncbi:MAG: hypothetical protein VXZ82_21180 [Planctomycetota bacterium]|nr:hypothetical protein [Planctomycetota bacterium]